MRLAIIDDMHAAAASSSKVIAGHAMHKLQSGSRRTSKQGLPKHSGGTCSKAKRLDGLASGIFD
jgi:hypothetical protein